MPHWSVLIAAGVLSLAWIAAAVTQLVVSLKARRWQSTGATAGAAGAALMLGFPLGLCVVMLAPAVLPLDRAASLDGPPLAWAIVTCWVGGVILTGTALVAANRSGADR